MQQSSHLLPSRTLKIHVVFFVAKTFKELKQGLPEMQRERKTHQDNTWGKTTKIDSYAYCRMPVLFSF